MIFPLALSHLTSEGISHPQEFCHFGRTPIFLFNVIDLLMRLGFCNFIIRMCFSFLGESDSLPVEALSLECIHSTTS